MTIHVPAGIAFRQGHCYLWPLWAHSKPFTLFACQYKHELVFENFSGCFLQVHSALRIPDTILLEHVPPKYSDFLCFAENLFQYGGKTSVSYARIGGEMRGKYVYCIEVITSYYELQFS